MLAMMHPARLSMEELARDCEVTRTRRGGPGGQHRNKVETAIVITHLPSQLRGEAGERRSQAQNQEVAWQRLRVNLALACRSEEDAAAAPSALWQTRQRGGKLAVSAEHDDFPALLAEALDVLANGDWDAPRAAQQLAVTTSQLVKFLQLEPRAIGKLNEVRRERGQKALR